MSFLSGQQVTNPPIDPIREKIVMSLVRGQLCYLRSFLNLGAFLFIVTGSLILLFVFVTSRHVLLGQNRIFLNLMWLIVIVCTWTIQSCLAQMWKPLKGVVCHGAK